MNLGSRCIQILENRCQCTNTATDNSEYCTLHNIMRAEALKPVDVNKSDEEDKNASN